MHTVEAQGAHGAGAATQTALVQHVKWQTEERPENRWRALSDISNTGHVACRRWPALRV